ncbi:hypothetical protein JCM10212_000652 [Sporobolomyces blumeae]
MQRYTTQLLSLSRHTHLCRAKAPVGTASLPRQFPTPRHFSTSPSPASEPQTPFASVPSPGQAGTDIGRPEANAMLEDEGAADSVPDVGPDTIEQEFVQHQKTDPVTPEARAKENQAGTNVGQNEPLDEPLIEKHTRSL